MQGIKSSARLRRRALNLPFYTLGEEILNAVTHGIAAGLAIAALVVLVVFSSKTAVSLFSVLTYGICMTALFLVSTLYHALPVCKGKKVFQILDHCTIFCMIAGTYTPMLLLCVQGIAGWVLFGVVWAAAVIGITLNIIDMKRFKRLSMACYLCMGWSCLLVVHQLVQNLSVLQLCLLVGGGIFYTVGAVVYAKGKRLPYMHTVFHLFVLAACVLQFFVVFSVATT